MTKLVSLTIALGIVCAGSIAYAQNYSPIIRVMDASGVEAISGIVLLVNPGDARRSQAFVTSAQGDITLDDLHCEICTISAFDPRGLFASRTTQFSSLSSSLSLVMQLRPIVDTIGDPQAVSIELVIRDFKGEPLAAHDLVIRPTVMTLEDNRLSIQKTSLTGHVSVQLRAGDYTVGVLERNAVSEARFEIATAKERCSSVTATCIVASPRSYRGKKPIKLQLSSMNATPLVHESGTADPQKR